MIDIIFKIKKFTLRSNQMLIERNYELTGLALISSQDPPSQARISQSHLSKPVAWHHLVENACLVVPSGFILISLKSVSLGSLQSFCHAFSSGVNIIAYRGSFSHLRPLPAARPGCPVPPVVEGWHSGTVSLTHSMSRAVKIGPPES